MALEDYIRETRALIKSFRDQADTLEKQLQTTLSLLSAGVLKEEQRKPTTWKPADDIQRILDYGKKTMLRNELIQSRREQAGGRRRGGRSTAPPVCYRGYTPWPRPGIPQRERRRDRALGTRQKKIAGGEKTIANSNGQPPSAVWADAGGRFRQRPLEIRYRNPPADLDQHAKEFLEKQAELPSNIVLVTDPDYKMTNLYGLRWDAPQETAYPSTFIIDKKGMIVFEKISHSHGDRLSAQDALAHLAAN